MENLKRNENVDLLKLVSMKFIVCIYYVGQGVASTSDILPLNFAFTCGIAVASSELKKFDFPRFYILQLFQ